MRQLRRDSFSSEPSDNSLFHQLEINTPFLRPAPVSPTEQEHRPSQLSESAAVLVNRARRPIRGITEDWIRTHTTHASISGENRHWFSDGEYSEPSSLSSSLSSDDLAWFEAADQHTPRARKSRKPRKRSSDETLKQAALNSPSAMMDNLSFNVGRSAHDAASIHTIESVSAPSDTARSVETPGRPSRLSRQTSMSGSIYALAVDAPLPNTPAKPTKSAAVQTPRLRKRVPWKGKTITVQLPREDFREYGDENEIHARLQQWEQQGYDLRGFDLQGRSGLLDPLESYSQSRNLWPNLDEMAREHAQRKFKVTLPDLNAWKNYVNELTEAKLKALGVSLGGDDAPAPSISPAPSNLSRQSTTTKYPPLPFSPPIPTSSVASGGPGFAFQGGFHGNSATQSPTIPSVASPVSFNGHMHSGKFNPRASISISPHELPYHFSGQPSPRGWSPQSMLLQQQLGRSRSPSVMGLNSLVSPTSPFHPENLPSPVAGMHSRHQSLQYPFLPHQHLQRRDSARASPRLQELREEEEVPSNKHEKSPSKTPEPTQFIGHNSAALQKEIDDAEYHLEEKIREQLDHEDYSPHNENEKLAVNTVMDPADVSLHLHQRGPSVHFGNFGTYSDEGPVLHHPQPHSRGHSLSQKPFFENDEVRDSTDEGSVKKPHKLDLSKVDEALETATNPSNMGTPVSSVMHHQRAFSTFSTGSNPWADTQSLNGSKTSSRRASHASKPSLSKFNPAAAEFKFNPTSSFASSQFNFGAASSQPTAFQAATSADNAPPSVTSSHFDMPSISSSKGKINAAAPVFSPGKSEFKFPARPDFSFSASGPAFNPDAPPFQPGNSLPPSVTSGALSGNESASNRPTSSIFSNIDLNVTSFSTVIKPTKTNRAIPIMRPPSRASPDAEPEVIEETDQDGRITDASRRSKKFREGRDDGDDVPLFAEPTPEPGLSPQPESNADDKPNEDDENAAVGDTTFASTVHSESTDGKLLSESNDTKATTSPSATSPDQEAANWTPFEFSNESDMHEFALARPIGDDEPQFKKTHKKSLSAAAKPFVPGAFMFGSQNTAQPTIEPALKTQPAPMVEPEESEDDRAGSPTPGPEPRTIVQAETEPEMEAQVEVEALSAPSPEPVEKRVKSGLGASRFASPPPASPSPQGLAASRFASSPKPTSTKPAGLAASRFAHSPSPVSDDETAQGVEQTVEPSQLHSFNDAIPEPVGPPSVTADEAVDDPKHEPTFEEIDEVMQHLKNDPTQGVNRAWHEPTPKRNVSIAAVAESSPFHLPPQSQLRSDAPSPSPRQYRTLPPEPAPMLSTELEDPFLDPPQLAPVSQSLEADGPVHRLNASETVPDSDWDDAFSGSEREKLDNRVQFFDGRVNNVVGNILADRLEPLEKTLSSVQHLLSSIYRGTPSSRRDRRSVSAEIQESDADDEDDDMPPARRSMSPRRDKRLEQIRYAVLDAMNQHQATRTLQPSADSADQPDATDNPTILKALHEMREQFAQTLHLDFRGEDLRNIVEEAVERRMPATPQPVVKDDEEAANKISEMLNRIFELEQRLRSEEDKVENETTIRRGAEDHAAELRRQLEQAETKIKMEIINRTVYDQRVSDLEERLKNQEDKTEVELQGRRKAEDRLSEIQRLLRISSEEEDRLRAVLEERDQKVRGLEQGAGKNTMRLALLEAAQSNADKTQIDLTNRLNASEEELRGARQEARHWRSEAEHARESITRQTDDLLQSVQENKHLRKLIDTLGTQLQENERIRESWRCKFISLQDDMAHAAREITEENTKRTKKEQALIARQEVLDAQLLAESRTRERLEAELERLEGGERAGMRAVSECKRLEGLLAEMRNENHKLQQSALRVQREYQEIRDRAAIDVQQARASVQAELEMANAQINVARVGIEDELLQVRAELAKTTRESEDLKARHELVLEEALSKIRAQIDQAKMDADTAKAHHDMMLEEAQNSKKMEAEELVRKHQNEVEDLQTRYERQIHNTTEDAQRAEQNLLERLSLETSKTEHLRDRVTHLEERLQIAQEAARAAAQAAKSAGVAEPLLQAAAPVKATAVVSQAMQLPEKISPQALRESIMVLQEQLQAREQRIEELEQTVSEHDPDAATKISKRDDEITWLRELLAVRHGDLQDIIGALSAEHLDKEAVKDAAIRLKANLQMEEQERERAMNGGSAINLPNIAATISAATPRVAQAVGPLAAAWGNWRKGSQASTIGNSFSSPVVGRNYTPSRSNPSPQSFLSGLMTPPASGLRSTPQTEQAKSQPTTFSSTTPPRRGSSARQPVTPPMMASGGYDADAHLEDFDDAGFFDD